MKSETIEVTAADGHVFSAYRSGPEDAPKGAVVVLHEPFGVNRHIRNVTDQFATQGYLAIAPALFDRLKKGVELGYDDAALAEGAEMTKQAGEDGPIADIQAVVDLVKDAGKVATVGYCWGGYLSFLAANRVNGLACAVGYYGGRITDEPREKRRIPTLLHFGERDPEIPFADRIVQFRARRPDVSVYAYAAGHAFNCEERSSYDETSARLALDRTLALVSQYVIGQPKVQLKNAGAYIAAKTEKKKKSAGNPDDGPVA